MSYTRLDGRTRPRRATRDQPSPHEAWAASRANNGRDDSPTSELLHSLPALLAQAAGRGQPVTFPAEHLPAGERGDAARRLLETLGVPIVAARETPLELIPAAHVPQGFRGEILGRTPTTSHVRRGSRWGPDDVQTVRRRPGRCVGCAIALDELTPGCSRCTSRHAMRRLERRRRDALEPAAA